MIVKSYEINKIDFNKSKIVLFYGENNGLKKDHLNYVKINFLFFQFSFFSMRTLLASPGIV